MGIAYGGCGNGIDAFLSGRVSLMEEVMEDSAGDEGGVKVNLASR